MSVPGNINPAPPPSSFDDNPDFFEESRWKKLKRRLIQEPLIPLGVGLTIWALVEATKSIRAGDKHKTNRMFRRRIYAQGFTILVMVAGSYYWEEDRKKRKEFEKLGAEKHKQERREKWLRELEIRDKEEDELRAIRDKMTKERIDASNEAKAKAKKAATTPAEGDQDVAGGVEAKADSTPILSAAKSLWRKP